MANSTQRVSFRQNGKEVGCLMCEVANIPDDDGNYGFINKFSSGLYPKSKNLPIKKNEGVFVVELPED